MNSRLIWITPNAEQVIAYCCRVSNPANQDNPNFEKLLRYCADKKHWSVFQMGSMCVEIATTRAIATQILRHSSFSFQQFCVAGDTLITTVQSSSTKKLPISKLYNYQFDPRMDAIWKRGIRVFDEVTQTFTKGRIVEIFKTGVKPVYKVVLSDGKSIKTTQEHKFLTKQGFMPLSDLSVGNFVAVNGIPVYQCKEWMANAKSESINETILAKQTASWKRIESVEYLGEEETYDLEVDHPSHNYIANGIVVHNSLRYAEAETLHIPEIRRQDVKNRQNSIDDVSEDLKTWWIDEVEVLYDRVERLYKAALEKGIAKECARGILPLSTEARLYMSGNIRSWITYLMVRANPDSGTQKEHFDIACEIKEIFREQLPTIHEAFFGDK